jgi:hypothetical protein
MQIPKALSSGIVIDMLAPDLSHIDIYEDIAMPLGKIARFDGQTPGRKYSVAQHCVIGADALLRETHDHGIAFAFLLHDAHEAFIGDITTPTASVLSALAGDSFPRALRAIKGMFDAQIYKLAGFELTIAHKQAVSEMDARMLNAERQWLLRPSIADSHWPDDVRSAKALPVRPVKWGTVKAAEEWFGRYLSFSAILDGIREAEEVAEVA